MAKTNTNPNNEAWLHDAVMGMEEDGNLAEFCAHIGLNMPTGKEFTSGETAWPLIKEHFTTPDSTLERRRSQPANAHFFPPTWNFWRTSWARRRAPGIGPRPRLAPPCGAVV